MGAGSMASGDGGALRRAKFHAVGVLFYLFVALSACLSVAGMSVIATTHAPTWAALLFASVLAINVPLGGVVSYVFFVSKKDAPDAPPRVP
jgi:hypothetical protein